ncbi:NEAT domain-containing protein [Levilactobacillus yonginensis]|uniref:NEAT domain-containing protein n=1 Tax=Levilactobacillus yonginensis TaxID=1054041 RepID=UPI00345DAB73
MRKMLSLLLLLCTVAVGVYWAKPALAQDVSYSALKYGTNQTSMASGYFVRPAKVVVKNHAYVVTMDIKTAKKLTSWPVTVTSVNGQSPQNVHKKKDAAGNSHLYYSFTTTSLKSRINAKLSINVPKVYKAKHNISFKFQTKGLPELNTSTAKKTTTAPVTNKAGSASASEKTSASSASSTKPSATSSKPTTSSISNGSHQSSTSSTAKSQEADSAAKVPAQKTHWGGLIGGIVAIVVLVGGGSWWYFGRH